MWCALLREQMQLCRSGTRGIFDFMFAHWPGSRELPGENHPLLSCRERIRQGEKKKKKEKSFNGLSNFVVQTSQLEYATSCALLSCVHRALLGCLIIAGLYGIL